MRIFNVNKGIKGSRTLQENSLRFRYMITEQAKRRAGILTFWQKYGTSATEEAFNIKRRTLFLWQNKLKEGNSKLESLNPIKRIPKNKRKRIWDYRILEEISRLRLRYKNLGKDKLYPLLADFCDVEGLECPSPSTIGRLLKDLGGLRDFPQKITGTGKIKKANRNKILRKPKHFKALYPGHCIAFDTIEKQRNGKRMYVIVAIDLYTRMSFALGTKSHASNTMAHFFYLISVLFPYSVKKVLSDNGSEFKKHFSTLVGRKSITHFHTYPRTPKMNAHCERLNRSLQEEFIDFNLDDLFNNITNFNKKFNQYLEFYNTKRVHHAFKNKYSPLQFMLQSKYYKDNLPEECKNGWTYTQTCNISYYMLVFCQCLQ